MLKLSRGGTILLTLILAISPIPVFADADDVTQEAQQSYSVEISDYFTDGTATATQHFVVFVNQENITYQHFSVTVYDPTIGLGLEGPDPIHTDFNTGAGSSSVEIQAYYGAAPGYTLEYYFDDTDLICADHPSFTIPTVSSDGPLTYHSWGQSPSDDPAIVPTTWFPAFTTSQTFITTSGPSAVPFDPHYLFIGAKADSTSTACTYYNTLYVTIISNS
jgi:hypothetical protein